MSASAPKSASLADQDAFDFKCVLYLHTERARLGCGDPACARLGCGDPACALETCSIARHARLVVRALGALAAADAPSQRLA